MASELETNADPHPEPNRLQIEPVVHRHQRSLNILPNSQISYADHPGPQPNRSPPSIRSTTSSHVSLERPSALDTNLSKELLGDKGPTTEHDGPRKTPRVDMEFWERYNRAADLDDQEFVDGLGQNLDNLLIFAGLFSGVNTAFIIESLDTVRPDHAEKTNNLLQSILLAVQNITVVDSSIYNEPFEPAPHAVRSTSIFFASLCCSLGAAFGAVMGKQWLNLYKREGSLKPPPNRARERQKKYNGRQRWHLEGILETLPTVLQISLFLFLIGVIDFLWPTNRTVAVVTAAFSAIPVTLYFIAAFIAIFYPRSPFQTRLSITIRQLHPKVNRVFRQFVNHVQLRRFLLLYQLDDLRLKLPPYLTFCCHPTFPAFLQHPFSVLVNAPSSALRWLAYGFKLVGRRMLLALQTAGEFVGRFKPTNLAGVTGTPGIPSNSDNILDLQCIIFQMKRATEFEEVIAVLDAMATTLQGISTGFESPALTSLANALGYFILKPTWDEDLSRYHWGTGVEPEHLLHPLRLFPSQLFEAIAQTGAIPPWALFRLVQSNLWRLLVGPSSSPKTLLLVTDIMERMEKLPFLWLKICPPVNLEILCQTLSASSPDEPQFTFCLSLLSQAAPTQLLPYTKDARFTSIHDLLISGMQEDRWRFEISSAQLGCVRAVWLAGHLGQATEDTHNFSKYLHAWCVANFGQVKVLHWYLQGILELLNEDRSNPFWPRQLEEDEHPLILLLIMQEQLTSPVSNLALLNFVTLWRMRKPSSNPLAVNSPYFTPLAISTIVRFWAISNGLFEMTEEQIVMLLDRSVLYLEEAKGLGLLTSHVDVTVLKYKEIGDLHLREKPEYGGRLDEWYGRMDRLMD